MWDCLKIAEHTTHLLTVFREPPMLGKSQEPPSAVAQS
jgi:hypothetical protein